MSEFIKGSKVPAHKIAAAIAFDLRKEVKTNFRGCRDDTAMAAADVIDELMQQRAELLEALKGVMYWDNGKSEWDIAREAITKAEAAE